jgi:hypothetical protein
MKKIFKSNPSPSKATLTSFESMVDQIISGGLKVDERATKVLEAGLEFAISLKSLPLARKIIDFCSTCLILLRTTHGGTVHMISMADSAWW